MVFHTLFLPLDQIRRILLISRTDSWSICFDKEKFSLVLSLLRSAPISSLIAAAAAVRPRQVASNSFISFLSSYLLKVNKQNESSLILVLHAHVIHLFSDL